MQCPGVPRPVVCILLQSNDLTNTLVGSQQYNPPKTSSIRQLTHSYNFFWGKHVVGVAKEITRPLLSHSLPAYLGWKHSRLRKYDDGKRERKQKKSGGGHWSKNYLRWEDCRHSSWNKINSSSLLQEKSAIILVLVC